MATHEGDPARSPRMTVAPDGDPARSPREVEAAPTSLLKVLLEMRKEKLIVPSRQIMRIVQEEERLVRMRATIEDEGHAFATSSAAFSPGKIPVLTQLVEQILEYCRLKLLDDDEDFRDMDEKAAAVTGIGEDERQQRLAVMLRHCTETYGQLLLAHSDIKPLKARSRPRRMAEASSDDNEDVIDKTSHVMTDSDGRRRVTKPPHEGHAHHPTPFYETVFALVARAVQQGMRAAAEGSKLSQEKGAFAQLAARVEKELACLFRSPEFGRASGRGLLKNGAKVDASGGSEGIESAQLAARLEAKINSSLREAEKLTALCKTSHFDQLEGRLQRQVQSETKIIDQAEKSPGGGSDNKETATGTGDHGTSESVDAIIAGFWARAIPRQKDQAISLQNVVSTRSPMVSSLLPSPRGQALGMKDKQFKMRRNGSRRQVQANAGHVDVDATGSSLPPLAFTEEPYATLSSKHTWAFSQERIIHSEIRQSPQAPRVLTNRVARLIV